ncbi:MAG: hypothetical protein CM15mP120_06540 [Pseudomonadota bacterium]|nr:MAG: hypothetical protein CM15mP120_06540 [Pseudomonadota bacterium]
MLELLGNDVPVIYFGTGNSHLLPQVRNCPFDVLAFDWRTPLVSYLGTAGLQGGTR